MRSALRLFYLASLTSLLIVAGCSSGGSAASGTGTSGGGTGGGTTGPTGALATGGASTITVIQQNSATSGSVLQFAATAGASATPAVTLPTSGYSVEAVAQDAAGQLYVGSGIAGKANSGRIQVYAAGATSTSTPIRTITGTTNTALDIPQAMAVDSTGQIYVLTQSGVVLVYGAMANGATDSTRVIAGNATQIVTPLSIAVDTAGNIYVANSTLATTGTILVFAATASGNAAPLRVITSPNIFYGMAVDSSQNLYAMLNSIGSVSTSIVEFSSTASGAATPTKTIAGASTGMSTVYGNGLQLDAANNLWISIATPAATNQRSSPAVLGFGPQASGNVAPGATINSASWTAAGVQLAVK